LKLICNNAINSLMTKEVLKINGTSFEDLLLLETAKQRLSEGDFSKVLEIIQKTNTANATKSVLPSYYSLLDATVFMQENNYFADVGTKIAELLENENTRDAESTMIAFLKMKLENFKRTCNSGCSSAITSQLQILNAQILTSQYLPSIKTAKQTDEVIFQFSLINENLSSEKTNALANASSIILKSKDAIRTFNIYFWSDLENSANLKSNYIYKSANLAMLSLEKDITAVSSILNAVSTNSSEKYSASLVKSQLNALLLDLDSLDSSNLQMKTTAEKEFSIAKNRQQQFGSDTTKNKLDEADDALESEHYFIAYRISNSLNLELLPSATPQPKNNNMIMAIPAILILAILSYYLLIRRQGEIILKNDLV
jgi:hypothetical protein